MLGGVSVSDSYIDTTRFIVEHAPSIGDEVKLGKATLNKAFLQAKQAQPHKMIPLDDVERLVMGEIGTGALSNALGLDIMRICRLRY